MTEPADPFSANDNGDDNDEPTCSCWFMDGPFGNCSSYDVRCPKCHGTGIPTATTGQ